MGRDCKQEGGQIMYRSKYEAYPFLSDKYDDLRCDYELATDHLTSKTGQLRALCIDDKDLYDQLAMIGDLIYHANACLRTPNSVTREEVDNIVSIVDSLNEQYKDSVGAFTLPQGSFRACLAHELRVDAKSLVRLMYRHNHQGHEVDPILFDLFNILSGYYFMLSLKLNIVDDVEEIPFISRNYKV